MVIFRIIRVHHVTRNWLPFAACLPSIPCSAWNEGINDLISRVVCFVVVVVEILASSKLVDVICTTFKGEPVCWRAAESSIFHVINVRNDLFRMLLARDIPLG